MRSKVEANDYRYFPDPDLLPVSISQDLIEEIKGNMPELPSAKKTRFINQYGLNEYDTIILVSDRELSEYFENTLKDSDLNPKMTANWIITEVLALAKKAYLSVKDYPVSSEDLKYLLSNVTNEIISSKQAKDVFERMWDNKENPRDIIENEGLKQISDVGELNKIVDNIIKNNYKSVEEYQSGKDKLLGFFVGQVMKETQGQGNPKIINQLLKEKLKK
jgi:aspartyl-tRNA(Asn)/glutamyl-tRNA(Gln) amidotransferase subunit B